MDAQQDLSDTYGSTQWLTGTMLTAGAWTGVSLALANGESEGAGFWESQAVAGALLTVPMVAIWMNEKLRVEPSFQRVGQDLYAELMAMNGTPVSFEELTLKPDNFEGDVIEESLFEEDGEDAGIDEVEQSVDSSEEDSDSNAEC